MSSKKELQKQITKLEGSIFNIKERLRCIEVSLMDLGLVKMSKQISTFAENDVVYPIGKLTKPIFVAIAAGSTVDYPISKTVNSVELILDQLNLERDTKPRLTAKKTKAGGDMPTLDLDKDK